MPPPLPTPPTVEVRPHGTKGRALYATRAFAPASAILASTPLLQLPTLRQLTTVCAHCFRPGRPRACTRCRSSFYCGAACQAADWAAAHSKECRALRRVPESRRAQLPTTVRALIRLLVVPGLARRLEPLEGHQARRRAGCPDNELDLMATAACSWAAGQEAGPEDVRRAVSLLCKIQTNAFHRSDPDTGRVGIFLDPFLAMANHSCMPNAFVHFIGAQAVLRAETPIEAGDEIEIAYTDYSNPLSKRRNALAHFYFECHCSRCQEDLNVYAACMRSPDIDLNKCSLAPDPLHLRHPEPIRPGKLAVADAQYRASAELMGAFESQALPEALPERRQVLQAQYRGCRGLVEESLWSFSPLPEILTEISVYFAESGDFASAVALACHVSTNCQPYRFVAPFHPVRVKGLATIAKMLAHTAASTAALPKQTAVSGSAQADLGLKAREMLRDIDQVSLCQMLLIMVLWATPEDRRGDWEVAIDAKAMLDEIGCLAGRQQELSVINEWTQNPDGAKSQSFFDFAVRQPVGRLADLAPAILRHDFG